MTNLEGPLVPVPAEYQPYALYELARPVGSWPVPTTFDVAAALDEQARATYARAEYRRAAERFMSVAASLQSEADRPYASVLAADRMLTYRNAAAAWAMADALDDARRALQATASRDLGNVESIRELLDNLPYPVPSEKPTD